jgi:hypothetical protein
MKYILLLALFATLSQAAGCRMVMVCTPGYPCETIMVCD